MRVKVQLFAAARQLAGTEHLELELPSGASVADLRAGISKDVPALQSLLAGAMFAVDAEYATDDTTLSEDAKIACIPPVSGG